MRVNRNPPKAVISRAHRVAVLQETIVCTVLNSALPAGAMWFLGKAPPESLIFGDRPIVIDMMLGAGLAAFLMTLMLTGSIRSRVRKGLLPFLAWPVDERGALRWLPIPLLLRAASLALLAMLLLVPAGLALVWALDLLPLRGSQLIVYNLAFGAAVGITIGPIVALAALADTPRHPPSTVRAI